LIGFLPLGNFGLNILEKKYIKQNINLEYDNIIVLAGSESVSKTIYSNILNLNNASERLISSVQLALKNDNAKIIFLGGSGFLSSKGINEADVAKMFYKDVGFNISRVTFIDTTRNTLENLKEFKKLKINKKNDLLVTSAFHMTRSLIIAKKLNLDLSPYAVDFRHDRSLESLLNSYQSFSFADNLKKTNIFFREIIGIIMVKIIL
jgi:uncharacterized SAM-binding protein YcdF (DUF218 family)